MSRLAAGRVDPGGGQEGFEFLGSRIVDEFLEDPFGVAHGLAGWRCFASHRRIVSPRASAV